MRQRVIKKKLNRKAVFKMKDNMRLGKTHDVLAKLLLTFADNETEAEAEEAKAKEVRNKLSASGDGCRTFRPGGHDGRSSSEGRRTQRANIKRP